MDRSTKVGSQPRRSADGASGKTGNALGPKHMMGNPAGRAQVTTQKTSASGEYRASGKRGNPRTLGAQGAIPDLVLKQNVAGVTFDFKPYFENYGAGAGTWVSTSVPAGMTLNSTTGVLSGTPTTVSGGSPTLTVLTGSVGVPPAQLVVPWKWSVVV
jgi:hypothetical protein